MGCLMNSYNLSMHNLEMVGDFLGAESYVEIRADVEDDVSLHLKADDSAKERRPVPVKKDYPPPLPWLPPTERLLTSEMPWVMRRSYTEDGRLIITEEKAERYQYFQLHRSDERLRLDIIFQVNDPFSDDSDQEEEEEEAAADDDHDEIIETTADEFVPAPAGCGVDAVAAMVEAASMIGSEDDGGDSGGIGGNNCSSSSLISSVIVPALHPVRT